MTENISIPTTDNQWRELLGIRAERLISSSMWSDKSITSGREIGIYPKGDCQFAVVNSLEMNSRIKINFCVFWEPVGSNCKSSSDKQRIAHFVSELPSEGFLHELKSTDQLAIWVYKKTFAIQFAKCWVAGDTTPDNPLIKDLEEGVIDQWESDYIWEEVGYYEQIWKLLRQRDRKIIKRLKQDFKCPFKSKRELLQEILREDFDNKYSPLLKQRCIWKNSDAREVATLSRKLIRGEYFTKKEVKILEKLQQQSGNTTRELVTLIRKLIQGEDFTPEELEILKDLQQQLGEDSIWLDQLVQQGCVFVREKLERLDALQQQSGGASTWLERLAQVCVSLGKKDPFIRSWLKIINAHEDALARMVQEATCDPELREQGYGRSLACIDGKIYDNLRKLP
jgi:hypothetical protein